MKPFIFLSILLSILSCKKEIIPPKPIGPVSFELVWEKRLVDKNEKILVQHPLLTPGGGLVYEKTFAGPDDIVTCLDRKTGNVRWTWEDPIDVYDGEKIGTIWAFQDKLAVCSWHETTVVDIGTGKTIWKSDVQNEGLSGEPRAVLINGQIYHGVLDAIPASTYSYLRRTPISENSWENLITIHKNTTIFNDVFSPSLESFAVWKNPQNGDSLLLFQNRQSQFFTNGGSRVDFYAFNLRSRQVEWKIDSIDFGSSVSAPILVNGNLAYFMGAVTLFAIDLPTGQIGWKKEYNERTPDIYAETLTSTWPVIANNKLIIKPQLERMFAYNPETGSEIWRTLDGCTGQSDTEVYKDWIFIPSIGNGDVWVHRLSDGKLVTRLKSPRHENSDFPQAYITHAIEIDQQTGMLYCTDGYSMMCFRIKTE